MVEEKKTTKKDHFYGAVGRRKSAVATVRLAKGRGDIKINDQSADQYLNNKTLVNTVREPMTLVGQQDKLDVNIKVSGGGKRGQADAISLSIARALLEMSEDFRASLKRAGLLTRDPREKERKKYGLKKARKAPQFSKR